MLLSSVSEESLLHTHFSSEKEVTLRVLPSKPPRGKVAADDSAKGGSELGRAFFTVQIQTQHQELERQLRGWPYLLPCRGHIRCLTTAWSSGSRVLWHPWKLPPCVHTLTQTSTHS